MNQIWLNAVRASQAASRELVEITAFDDAYILGNNPGANTGSFAVVDAGTITTASVRRMLIRADLSTVPAGANVVAAVLRLRLSRDGDSSAAENANYLAYPILRNWIELQATWNVWSTGNNWTTAGCGGVGTDRQADSKGSGLATPAMLAGDLVDITLDAALVQSWLDGTLANNGVIIQPSTELNNMYRFHSSESSTTALRPKLILEYT